MLRGKNRTILVALCAAASLLLAGPALAKPGRGGHPSATVAWAPPGSATIHPGVQTRSPSGQCTANFIFTNGSDVLIGQAAHCTGSSAATSTNGCEQESPPLPLGSPVEIEGATRPGTLVYSSWNAMIASGETDPDACGFNDFALIRLDPADVAKVNPSVPVWGGPAGTGTSAGGENVYTYGNSSLRLGLTQLSPKSGVTVLVDPSGWSYEVYTATPGIPGDSGSAVLNAAGQGLGILVTVAIAPTPGSNGVTDLGRAVAYARSHGLGGLTLVNGTEPFNGSITGILPL